MKSNNAAIFVRRRYMHGRRRQRFASEGEPNIRQFGGKRSKTRPAHRASKKVFPVLRARGPSLNRNAI